MVCADRIVRDEHLPTMGREPLISRCGYGNGCPLVMGSSPFIVGSTFRLGASRRMAPQNLPYAAGVISWQCGVGMLSVESLPAMGLETRGENCG